MNKGILRKAIDKYKAFCRQALEDFLSELNQGQRKKILKKENIRRWCVIFGVEIEEEE